ncbi:hypothetical protein FAGAP_9069 [Fusarium agapanthi]|uniref:Uncharacterized protein n=1 Tax=Fusarium agapanthi TaxID=1803897 RepID=A0A9P5E9G7_9HYPO|nr:hypothetical protein FAGAP_9069 [Fusarium agapanthi]
MPAASLTLSHRYKLSKTDCKPSPTAVFHKRLTNSHSDVYQRTRHIVQAKLNPTAKETWDTASKDGGDDGAPIDHKPYNALVLLFNPGYRRAGNLFPARLRTPKNALNADSGYQVDLGPALRIGPLPTFDRTPQALGIPSTGDHYRAATGESSTQKRPPASPGKSSSTSKKQRKGSSHHDGRAQSDTGSGDDEDEGDRPSRDGLRFPLPNDSPDRLSFACPFCKNDRRRYKECIGLQITAMSYVIQHIRRRHVLKEVSVDVQETTPSMGDITYRKKRRNLKKIVYYCARCREEFRGSGADVRWGHHAPCQERSIAQAGVLLPGELELLQIELRKVRTVPEKWEKMWTTLFPGIPVPSPYNEAEGTVSVGDVAQLNSFDVLQLQPIPSAFNWGGDGFFDFLPNNNPDLGYTN